MHILTKLSSLSLLLIFWSFSIFAQNIKNTWIPWSNTNQNKSKKELLGIKGESMFFLSFTKDFQPYLENFDHKVQLKWSFKLPSYMTKIENPKLVTINKKIYLMYTLQNENTFESGLFATEICQDSLNISATKLLYEHKENNNNYEFKLWNFPEINNRFRTICLTSANSQGLSIVTLRISEQLDIKKISEHELKSEKAKNSKTRPMTYPVDLTQNLIGDICVLIMKKSDSQIQPIISWEYLILKNNSEKSARGSLNPNNSRESLRLSPNRTVMHFDILGYSIPQHKTIFRGGNHYRITINENNDSIILDRKEWYLAKEVTTKLESIQSFQGNSTSYSNNDIFTKIFARSDSSIIILTQNNFRTNETMLHYSQGVPYYREIERYYQNEIIASCIDHEGIVKWQQIIPIHNRTDKPNNYNLLNSCLIGNSIIIIAKNTSKKSKLENFVYVIDNNGIVTNGDSNNIISNQNDSVDNLHNVGPNSILMQMNQNKKGGVVLFQITED